MINRLFEVEFHDINPFKEVVYVHDHSAHNILGELHTRERGFHKGQEFDEVLHIPINLRNQPILGNLVLVHLLQTHDVGYVTLGKINEDRFMKLEDFCENYL